jgi:hypothetical protein
MAAPPARLQCPAAVSPLLLSPVGQALLVLRQRLQQLPVPVLPLLGQQQALQEPPLALL